jgi:hypothetical protein
MACFREFEAIALTGLLAVACGGSGNSGALSGANDGAAGNDSSVAEGSANEGSAPAEDAGDSAPSAQDASDGSLSMPDAGGFNDGALSTPDAGDATSDAAAPPCPDMRGAYAITAVDATGCGNSLNASARECIRQGVTTACGITLQSMVSGGGNVAINGDATLQDNGSFSGAALTEGMSNRTGCTGTWDAGSSTLTVDCGGTSATQACVLALRRTGATCN